MKINKKYTALIILGLSIFLLLVAFAFNDIVLDFNRIKELFKNPVILVLNLIPIILILCCFYFAINNLTVSFAITSVIIFSLGIANRTKIFYRKDPIKLVDLALIKEAKQMMDIDFSIKFPVWAAFIIVFMIILILILRKNDFKIRNKIIRYCSFFTTILFLVGTVFLLRDSNIYNKNKAKNYNEWVDAEVFKARGLVYSFIHSSRTLGDKKPYGYDENAALEILKPYSDEKIPDDKKVNVIGILLESFNDFSKFNIDFTKDPYKDYHEIIKSTYHGHLVTNVFGGGTVNTERSFLTGYYTHPSYEKKVNSYVWYFKNNGYFTEALHPLTGAFYNRITAYKNLGFDNYYYDENYFKDMKNSAGITGDDDLFKTIMERLKYTNDLGDDYFNFTITFQNHGPYDKDKPKTTYFEKKDLDVETYNQMNNYFHGIEDTGKNIKKLIEEIRNYDKPIVVMMFGDHNPYLGDGDIGYKFFGISFNIEEFNGYLNQYETPYLIAANKAAEEKLGTKFVGDAPRISPQYMMPVLLQKMGIKGSGFNQHLTHMMTFSPIYGNQYVEVNGKLYFREEVETQETKRIQGFADYYNRTHFSY